MNKLQEMLLEENRTRIEEVLSLGDAKTRQEAIEMLLASTEALRFNPPQTDVSIDWKSDEFIAEQVLPYWDVPVEDPKVPLWDKDDQYRLPDDRSSHRADVKVEDIGLSTFSPLCKLYATADVITPNDIRQAGAAGLTYYRTKINEFKTEQLLRSFEKRVADIVFANAQYAASNKLQLAGPTLWSDKANSQPVDNMFTYIDACFKHPTHIVFGKNYWKQWRVHPQVLDAMKGQGGVAPRGGAVTSEQTAAFLEVPNVLIGRAKRNTATKGQTAVYADMWTNAVAILHIDPNPGPRTQTFGATFTNLKRYVGTKQIDIGVEGGEKIVVGMSTHEYIISNSLGCLIYQ